MKYRGILEKSLNTSCGRKPCKKRSKLFKNNMGVVSLTQRKEGCRMQMGLLNQIHGRWIDWEVKSSIGSKRIYPDIWSRLFGEFSSPLQLIKIGPYINLMSTMHSFMGKSKKRCKWKPLQDSHKTIQKEKGADWKRLYMDRNSLQQYGLGDLP